MEKRLPSSPLLSLALAFIFLFLAKSSDALQVGFYNKTCPDVEKIVRKTVIAFYKNDSTITAPLLRLHFHDCFVEVSCLYICQLFIGLLGFFFLTFESNFVTLAEEMKHYIIMLGSPYIAE